MINEDMVKALRCVASASELFDCHAEKYNAHLAKGERRMGCCSTAFNDGIIPCPYYQDTYGTCYEEGELSDWLNELADDLEQILKEREMKRHSYEWVRTYFATTKRVQH